MKSMLIWLLLLVVAIPANATILVHEDFESHAPGSVLATFGPAWSATTPAWTVGNQSGLAAGGTNYLAAPSRFGGTNQNLTRFGWYDASSDFNNRPAGENIVVASVKMYVPDLVQNTYGGMWMFDQAGGTIAVIGVDMATGQTLTSATGNVNNIGAHLGQYNDIKLIADFITGQVDYLFNGVEIGSRIMTSGNLTSGFSDFDFYNNGFNATGTVAFRYDDYMIDVSSVPEPSTLAMLALGLAGGAFIACRRKNAGAA